MSKQISGVKLTVADQSDKLVAKAVELFSRRWKERTRVPLKPGASGGWELVVGTVNQPEVLAPVKAIGLTVSDRPQSYVITTAGRTVTVCGADGIGVLYGLGYLLRHLEFEANRVPIFHRHESRTPAVYNRGVYFATHFNNWYETAPIEEVERYIEEMALWGFDLLYFWFDGNWFPHGFWKDPNSRGSRMTKRLRRIGEVARACGLKVASLGVANEGFAHLPPPELRTDSSARHGGFYPHSQICASKPGGLKLILEVRRKILELIGPIDSFTIWPYDQGGCGCDQCTHAPGRWGRKFLEIGPALATVVREVNPNAKIFVSTWLMDEPERNMVYELCDQKAVWFQGVMTEVGHATERKLDPRYERLVFPEISMFDCYFCSYGCNGANPAPKRFAVDAVVVARAGCGTALYSEGCYEDINKITYASLLWNPGRDVAEVVTEYTRYYFGNANVKTATELIAGLETTWGAAALLKAGLKTVAALEKQAAALKARLPRHADALMRWRMLYDRAVIDLRMKQAQGWKELATETRSLFEELGYGKGKELRRRLKHLLGHLQAREKQVQKLFEAHWDYMRFFHFEKNVMIFLPDEVIGKYNFDPLVEPISKALRLRDDEQMRTAASQAIKRWFWCNGIDYNYLFA